MRTRAVVITVLLIALSLEARTQEAKSTTDIYVVDVEGGNAVLIVSPSGESLLIDTGNLNAAARDAGRIMAAVQDAGLQRIDHLVTTHWHLDHFGGMATLAGLIPIREFIDHGANVQPRPEADAFLQRTYPRLYANATHTVVKAGDVIPIPGIAVRVVASAGETIKTALPGAGKANPYCANHSLVPTDYGENGQSIGIHITFGQFRFLHLGDLSSDREFELMCPENRLGAADLFVVSHHGKPNSNSEVLVHAIESRVAIMNNSLRKGGDPEVMKVLHSAPRLEDLWQLQFSELSGQEYNTPGMFIANHADTAYWIKVSAKLDGSFTVTNPRTDFTKTYHARGER